jgi:hypothetical protein
MFPGLKLNLMLMFSAWNNTVSKPMYSGCTSRLSEALHGWEGIIEPNQSPDFSEAVISCDDRRKSSKSRDQQQQQQQQLLLAHTDSSSHCTRSQDLKFVLNRPFCYGRHRTGRAVNDDENLRFYQISSSRDRTGALC